MKNITTIILTVFGFISAQNPLLIPETLSGNEFNLNLQNGNTQFLEGTATQTMGANGDILAPTLIFDAGEFIDIYVTNNIGEETTIHWHGMHVSAINDGGPHTVIMPGETWNPHFTVRDKATTMWYHPHLHQKTNEHVTKGISGFILVKDEEEEALELPRTYGVDDIPLLLQTKQFDSNNQIIIGDHVDNVPMVNATIDAYVNVPAQIVRLRLLNGSSMRAFNIGFSDNSTFYQIGSDGGLLSEPLIMTRLLLAPGERAEILVDFNGMLGESIELMSYGSTIPNSVYGTTNIAGMMGAEIPNYNNNPLNGSDFSLLQIDITEQNDNPVIDIPTSLVNVTAIDESESVVTRTIQISPEDMMSGSVTGPFQFNGESFDMDIINQTVELGNTEIWEIFNMSMIAHPFHIHDVQFYIIDRNGVAPNPNEQGRKDVVLVKQMETVRFITKFEDFADDEVPYMYHCHMLQHEDEGLMGQFIVYSDQSDITVEYAENWNLVGLPLNVEDSDYLSLFPSAVEGTLYSYDGAYISDINLIQGEGYWLRFNNAGSTTITGTPTNELTISLNEGWNLISGISTSINVLAIEDPDEIIISGTVYGFISGGYLNAEILEPGKGYWIRANNSGFITLIDN